MNLKFKTTLNVPTPLIEKNYKTAVQRSSIDFAKQLGLDSSSCTQCVKLLKELAQKGRTVVCTIHQPSATMFAIFDQVYALAAGRCLYQGLTSKLIPFLETVGLPCPMFHNPADYIIELACGEYGDDKIDIMVAATENGKALTWFENADALTKHKQIQQGTVPPKIDNSNLEATSALTQLKILLKRDFIKAKRDTTLTYLRIGVNFAVALMLGTLYWKAGADGSKVIDNYNLLFSILMHHMMTTMMLTILTYPTEMSILIKEHFNRWYSLKMYYFCITIIDIPISVFCCLIFTVVVYISTAQPLEMNRLAMFGLISLLVIFVAQSFGLMIGAICNVVNGTFLGPTLAVPMMMFAGFGVTLRDLPVYLYWGSYVSYLRYGLEGYVGAIYGLDRETMFCPEDKYCHYKYPEQFLEEIAMRGDQFWNDIIALIIILFFLRILSYVLLKWKLTSLR
ncbi:abc transporter g family member 28 [Holotrichia oblita]|uniref:Abc transporter g family member 28 n=1 Tax=Holotrichia oblita TaxID=644536 RepID=A0ACB9T915_HOLOL|nr:abc transporter g family member 28 [Holotrichia oblita]